MIGPLGAETVRGLGLGIVVLAMACGDSADPVAPGDDTTSSGAPTTTRDGSTATSASAPTTTDPDSTTADSTTDPTNLDDLLRLHHIQVKGTHNSYHLQPNTPLDPSHEYSHAPLAEQLESQGVRAFELDVHRELDDTLSVYHIIGIDSQSTCDTLALCLLEIKTWSDEHPEHLPIIVWLELKDDTGGYPLDKLEPLALLDEVVTGVFPPEQLLTPDDVQGDYPTLRERLQAEGWPTLGELRGQVLVTILDTDTPAEVYTAGFTTLAGRPLFVRADSDQLGEPWAAIAKLGTSDAATLAAAQAGNFLVATNVCGAGESDEACFAARQTAMDAGFHMLKDDFPAAVPERDYWLDFPDGNPARCNPATAPAECTSTALESL